MWTPDTRRRGTTLEATVAKVKARQARAERYETDRLRGARIVGTATTTYSKFREWLYQHKASPCMDCGGTFPPVCMDFDHRPGEVKLFPIGKHGFRFTRDELLAEIAKCDLVCANCHRIRTFNKRSHSAACSAGVRATEIVARE